ncbi:MAG: dipeptide epimerase [Thalassotalea sp.]|nr:dipeptide epimerase [Thalassotalea sp.]
MSKKVLEISHQQWQLHTPFVIARSSRTATDTVTVKLHQEGVFGIGECVPTKRYGESVASVVAQLHEIRDLIESGISRQQLQQQLTPGAARNALDCALWDLEAKLQGIRVSDLLQCQEPHAISTVQTISIGTPEEMGQAAKKLKDFPMLKVKLNQEDIYQRMCAVHENAPNAKLLIDANESWTFDTLTSALAQLKDLPVCMIEQPFPQGEDHLLSDLSSTIPIGADESCHHAGDIDYLKQYYDVVNIKLDKCGGLTEALNIVKAAKAAKLQVMVGCMVGSSLSMAPALFVAMHADYIDLDGSTMLCEDAAYGLNYQNGIIDSLPPALWGGIVK